MINFLCELIGWLVCYELLVTWLSKRIWQQEYVALVDGEDFSQFLIASHLHDTFREVFGCLKQRILINLHVVHDNVYLRLLINFFSDLHNAISCKLDSILHVLIHLALVADKNDMRNA